MNGRASVTGRWFGSLAIAGALAMLVSGCSDDGFPAVHDIPGPRIDNSTLTPDQVKQATDNLASDRDHLTAEVQSAPAAAPNNTALPPQPPPVIIPAAAQSTSANSKP